MNLEPRESLEPSADKKPEPAATEATPPPAAPLPLTPEEQMALFEQELKETDWGHQPC